MYTILSREDNFMSLPTTAANAADLLGFTPKVTDSFFALPAITNTPAAYAEDFFGWVRGLSSVAGDRVTGATFTKDGVIVIANTANFSAGITGAGGSVLA